MRTPPSAFIGKCADDVETILDVVGRAEISSCLDAPEDYLAVMGPDGVAALKNQIGAEL